MNKHEFLSNMDKVLAFWPTPNEQKEPAEFKAYSTWLDVIYEKVKFIDGARFPAVMDALLDVRPRFRKDLDHRRLIAIYKDLAAQNGWEKPITQNCKTCFGERFLVIWIRDKKGHEFRAVKGCGTCNYKLAHLHEDFTEIDAPPAFEQREINLEKLRTIPPAFAGCLLGIADTMGHKPKQEIVDALVAATCQPEVKTILRRPSEEKRKNELVLQLVKAPPVVEAGTAGEEPAKTEPPAAPAEQPSPAPPTKKRKIRAEEAEAAGVPF